MVRPFAHPVACCWMLLSVVAQSLKPVKLFSQQLPTFLLFRDRQSLAQQCWIRLHGSSFTGSTKNDTWSISGNVIGSEAKIPAKCCWDERSDGSCFWQWQRCNFLPLWEIKNYFGQSFDVCVFFREYSVLKLAKNRIGVVWFTVIDVEIAGLHVEDCWTLSQLCMLPHRNFSFMRTVEWENVREFSLKRLDCLGATVR